MQNVNILFLSVHDYYFAVIRIPQNILCMQSVIRILIKIANIEVLHNTRISVNPKIASYNCLLALINSYA